MLFAAFCAPPHHLSPRLPARGERLSSKCDPLPLRRRGDRRSLSLPEGEGRSEGGPAFAQSDQ